MRESVCGCDFEVLRLYCGIRLIVSKWERSILTCCSLFSASVGPALATLFLASGDTIGVGPADAFKSARRSSKVGSLPFGGKTTRLLMKDVVPGEPAGK